MKNPQVSETTTGIVIGILVALLLFASITIFWEAQVITNQQAVIHELLERNRP